MDDDPLAGLRVAVGDAFEGEDAARLKQMARERISQGVPTETEARDCEKE